MPIAGLVVDLYRDRRKKKVGDRIGIYCTVFVSYRYNNIITLVISCITISANLKNECPSSMNSGRTASIYNDWVKGILITVARTSRLHLGSYVEHEKRDMGVLTYWRICTGLPVDAKRRMIYAGGDI